MRALAPGKRHLLALSLALALSQPAAAQDAATLTLLEPQTIHIDPTTHSGSGSLCFQRTAGTASTVKLLQAGNLAEGNRTVPGQITIAPPSALTTDTVYRPTAEQVDFCLKVTVSNVLEVGDLHAPILYDQKKLGEILIHQRPTFNVGLQTTSSGVPTLVVEREEEEQKQLAEQTFVLKNDDAATYPVLWQLSVGSEFVQGNMSLPSNGANVSFRPAEGWFHSSFTALFKDEVREGWLTLRYAPNGKVDPYAPSRVTPVKVELRRWGSGFQALVGSLVLMGVLLLGGLSSLALNHWVPNKLSRLDLKERLERLAKKTGTLSDRIDSYARVKVKVERRSLVEDLASRKPWYPDFADALGRSSLAFQSLERRVDLLEEVDTLLEQIDSSKYSGLPPRTADAVKSKLGEVAELLSRGNLQDTDLLTVQTEIAGIGKTLDAFSPGEEVLAKLREELTKLWKDFQEDSSLVSKETYKRLHEQIRGFLDRCKEYAADPNGVDAQTYAWVEGGCEKLSLLRDYVQLCEEASQEGGGIPLPSPDRERQLIEAIRREGRAALADAKLLIRQVKEGVYVEDVRKALEEGQFRIAFEPRAAVPYEPVRFEVRLHNPRLDTAAASEKIVCVWEFRHKPPLKEKGWEICHFFPPDAQSAVAVKVSFEDEQGRPIEVKNQIAESFPVHCPSGSEFGERARLELIRLAVVLGAAMLGLLAGAKAEVLKMDIESGLVTVFLLGFGVDAIKNVLAKK